MIAATTRAAAHRMIDMPHCTILSFVMTMIKMASVSALLAVPASAQQHEQARDAFATKGVSYRNEASIHAGVAWQYFKTEGFFSPDETLVDRTVPSLRFHFNRVLAEPPQEDPDGRDIVLSMQRAGRLTVDLSKISPHVAEPEELRAEISTTGMVAPFLALGGRLTYVHVGDELFDDWSRRHFPEQAGAVMLAAAADIWITPRLMLRESVGGGRYAREGSDYHGRDDGLMLCFGHELQWDIDRTVSYGHSVRLENWEDYRNRFDLVNRVDVALCQQLICGAGIYLVGLYTREYSDVTVVGYLLNVRYVPVPWLFSEVTVSTQSAAVILEDRDQHQLQFGIGTRF